MSHERSLTVSEAMSTAKRALEGVRVTVVGEVSEFNDKSGYKAAYFTVCDEGAAMPCMMWRDAYVGSGVPLRCGMLVQMTGFFSAYVPKGRMQFMVRTLALAGEGQLRLQVAQLAKRLEAEGHMRPEGKRALPTYPNRVAVVTSPRGKAVHDVIRTLRRRFPLAEVVIAGVQVEGAAAAAAIVDGLRVAAAARPDVILLVRGGGSYEDLMPFNAEAVARAIVACPVPVVTGIGHEPDTTIADMVADMSASTPTAAAENAAPAVAELVSQLDRVRLRLGRALLHRVQSAGHRIHRIVERPVFSDPRVLLGSAAQTLDLLGGSLHRALPMRLERDDERLGWLRGRMLRSGARLLDTPRAALAIGASRLEDRSPLAILGRGYAVCTAADGRTIVREVSQVREGDRITVRVSDGNIPCTVEALDRDMEES